MIIKRYLKLLYRFFKTSFMVEIEYRVPFLIWVINDLIWLWITFVYVDLTFIHVDQIAGWTRGEIYLLAAVFSLSLNMQWLFILPNLTTFNELINKGNLDLILTKPVNTRFWVSTVRFEFDMAPRTVVLIPVFYYALKQLSYSPSIMAWIYFVISFIACFIISYCFYFSIAILNFWFTNIFNLADLFANIKDVGRYPSEIFKGITKIFFAYILPTAFMGPVSTLFLLGKLDLIYLLIITIISMWLLVFTNIFWNFAIKRYSSASS